MKGFANMPKSINGHNEILQEGVSLRVVDNYFLAENGHAPFRMRFVFDINGVEQTITVQCSASIREHGGDKPRDVRVLVRDKVGAIPMKYGEVIGTYAEKLRNCKFRAGCIGMCRIYEDSR